MRTNRRFCVALLVALALFGFFGTRSVQAGPITYLVSADTSQLSGQSGYLDFQFNPGGAGAASATATVTDFSPVANLNPSDPNNYISPNVTGSLSGTLTIPNSTAFNDFFEAFTFGNTIQFNVTLSGDALNPSNPSGSNTIGSSFAFSLYASDAMTPLLTTDANGSVLTLIVNGNGTTSVLTFPQSPGNPPVASGVPTFNPVPAPPSLVLCLCALPGWLVYWRRSKQTLGIASCITGQAIQQISCAAAGLPRPLSADSTNSLNSPPFCTSSM